MTDLPPYEVVPSAELYNEKGEPLIGIFLSPPRLFGAYTPDRPHDGLRIDYRIPIEEHEVLVTRTSGLFVKVPSTVPDYLKGVLDRLFDDDDPMSRMVSRRTAFLPEAARLFNLVLCEMAFYGIVSAPASSVQVAPGWLVRGTHAVITQSCWLLVG